MGTSTRNTGQSGHNPLIPTWLEDDPLPTLESAISQELGTQPQQPETSPQPILPTLQIPPEADPNRFRGPRTSFTHFTSSGGRDSSTLRRGVSHYISRSLGGSRNATKRLGASRTSTARLYNVLHTLSGAGGLQKVASLLSLDTLEGLPAADFFIHLAKFICPDGGPEDEGISRSAYYDTVADNPEMMEKPTQSLTKEEIDAVFQRYMAKIVMQQILNGIANNVIRFSETLEEISHIEDVVEQLIEQSVSDACAQVKQDNVEMTNERAKEITDGIYLKVFEILEGAGE